MTYGLCAPLLPARILLVPMPDPCGSSERLVIRIPPPPNTRFSCSSSATVSRVPGVSTGADGNTLVSQEAVRRGRATIPAQIRTALRSAAGACGTQKSLGSFSRVFGQGLGAAWCGSHAAETYGREFIDQFIHS